VDFSESQIIAALAEIFVRPDSRVIVGIGDDAAVVSTTSRTVVTTDMAVEGVHFRREWSTAFEIGRKITVANLADIYAMGAVPDHMVVSVALTGDESLQWIKELATGIDQEARKCDVTVVGGDVVRGRDVTISIAAFGRVGTPVLRSGARVGDSIFLSSLPGWSAAGFYLLSNKIDLSKVKNAEHAQRAIAQFRAPLLDYSIAREFRFANALCDVSDGLMTQGRQMAIASGVVLLFDSELIMASTEFAQLNALADEVGADVWDWVGAGGEDHVMLGTGAKLPGIRVGTVMEIGGAYEEAGAQIEGLEKLPEGFKHFL
jgi:thiamine-monophosphate kinase